MGTRAPVGKFWELDSSESQIVDVQGQLRKKIKFWKDVLHMYLCSPLSVVANATGKLCLVLNLKYLNNYLHVIGFKYEDLRTVALMFEADEYLFKFDLKSGYHYVDVHPEYHKFLGFQWELKGV